LNFNWLFAGPEKVAGESLFVVVESGYLVKDVYYSSRIKNRGVFQRILSYREGSLYSSKTTRAAAYISA